MAFHNLRAVLVVAVSATLATPAANGADSGERAARQDARAYLRAADTFVAAGRRLTPQAKADVRRDYASCESGYEREPEGVQAEITLQRIVFEQLRHDQLLIPLHGRFARAIALRRSRDPQLRKTSVAVTTLARERAKLGNVRVDFCLFLASWRDAEWDGRFPAAWRRRLLYSDAGIRYSDVRGANRTVVAVQQRLRTLGLSLTEAARFSGTALLAL